MFELVNKAKKKNKGFSLVELIVVILIIAIIAVALAPQVMKWVGRSSESTDANNTATIKSAVSAAISDYQSQGGKIATDNDAVYLVKKSGLADTHDMTTTVSGTAVSLKTIIQDTMGGDYPELKNESNAVFKITVEKTTGQVTVTTGTGVYAS